MRRERYYQAGAVIALLLVAAAAYVPGLRGPFVFDDLTNILLAPGVRIDDLGVASLLQAWSARNFDDFLGRPLAMLSFGLNYYFSGFDTFYFKLTNLVIHLATGVALFALTLVLLRRHQLLVPHSPYLARHLPWLALAITACWMVHPLNLTSVLYVVQRMTSLSALFTVLGLIGYCLGREQIIRGRKLGFLTIVASLALFGLLGLLCKENGALLLPLAALIELAFYRFATSDELLGWFRRFWYVCLIAPLVVAAIVVLIQYERFFGAAAYGFRDFTLEERLLTQARVLWFYIRLAVLPDISVMGLYHDDIPYSRGLLEPATTLFALLGIVGLVVIALASRKRAPILFFTIGWFLVGHSMESTILPLEMVHEHRNYLPLYGLVFSLVYYVGAPSARLQRTLRWRAAFLALFGVLLAFGTYSRSVQWQDEYSLYTREVINHPKSPRTHTMLGALLHELGFREQARDHLAAASGLTPHRAEHLIRLVGHLYAADGHVAETVMRDLRQRLAEGLVTDVALWAYEPLLENSQDDPVWHDRFLELYAIAIERPDLRFGKRRYDAVYRQLAEGHARRGRAELALQYFERARALFPRPRYDLSMAEIYLAHGCHDKAEGLVRGLRTRRAELAQAEIERLRRLESEFERESAGCALATPL